MDFLENEVFKKSFVFLFLFISPEPDDVEKRAAYRRKDNFISFPTVCSTFFYFEYCSQGAEKRHYTFFCTHSRTLTKATSNRFIGKEKPLIDLFFHFYSLPLDIQS